MIKNNKYICYAIRFGVICTITLLAACVAPERTVKPALTNVSYASVVALPVPDTSITLAYGADALQFGKLYLPKAATVATPVPLLVFVHGGCWLDAYDIAHSHAFSQAVADAGIAVFALEYRRTGNVGGGWPGSLADVSAGLAFAKTALGEYPVDYRNIVVAGHSAGGQLALLASATGTAADNAGVRGVIGLAAITDMAAYAAGDNSCQRATASFMTGTAQQLPYAYRQASPAQQLMPPGTLLLQGSSDTIVPISQATDSGMPYRLITNAGHFDWIHPHSLAYNQFLTTLKELVAQ